VIVSAPIGVFASAGGIDDRGSATIDGCTISGNRVEAAGISGEVVAFAGGIDADGSLVIRDSTVDHNAVTGTGPASAAGLLIVDAGGIEVDGVATIIRTRILANAVAATAPDGLVPASGGGLGAASGGGVTVRDSVIARNTVTAASAKGPAFAQGGGVQNFGLLTLEKTVVVDNSAAVDAPGGFAQGGGIWNSNFDGGPPTIPALTLVDSVLSANRLTGSAAATVQGGGLYTTFPVTSTRTVIAGNEPGQCFGC